MHMVSIRTRPAELQAIQHLRTDALKQILPIVEITRARKTKIDFIGEIGRSVRQFHDVLVDVPTYVDLTTEEGYSNSQIDELYQEDSGYRNWLSFLHDNFSDAPVVPLIQFCEGGSERELALQAEKIKKQFGKVGIRLPMDYEFSEEIFSHVALGLGNRAPDAVILDFDFVKPGESLAVVSRQRNLIASILQFRSEFTTYGSIATSYPFGLLDNPNFYLDNEDNYGFWRLSEVEVHTHLRKFFPEVDWVYGDYAGIHPHDDDLPKRFVPRIDVPLEEEIFYYRYRKKDGGYIRAAQEALADDYFTLIGAWGESQIKFAAEGNPPSSGPVHWIAVRMNLFIERQVQRLSM